jgi:hypothetical protein
MAAAHTKGFFSRNWSKVKRKFRYVNQVANFTIPLAAGKVLRSIYIAERNGLAITGGLRIGTAAAGTQVLVAGAVAASALVNYPPVIGALSKVDQTLYVEAVTSWNGAQVDVVIEYEEVPYN